MSFSGYMHKRLAELLDEKRVVVWYDGEHVFEEVATNLKARNCLIVSAASSRLVARKRADEILSSINNPTAGPAARDGNLLIYAPWERESDDHQRCEDPFESFAVIGAAFGDKDGDKFQSLARMALPARAAEIDRLFSESRPTVAMIDGLVESVRYPLLVEALGTDSAVEVAADLLCRADTTAKLSSIAGSAGEALRLLRSELGFSHPGSAGKLDSVVDALGRYVLFSEFVLDLPGSSAALPSALATVPHADESLRSTIYSVCERMRGSDDMRDSYLRIAQAAENALRLRDVLAGARALGVRDTFPFQEHYYLAELQKRAQEGQLDQATDILERHRQSVWRNYLPERALLWKLAERCVDLLRVAQSIAPNLPNPEASVRTFVQAMPDCLWQLDRAQRLVEQGAAKAEDSQDVEEIVHLARDSYAALAGRVQRNFLAAVKRDGWPPEGILRQTQIFDRYVAPALAERRRVAYFLVDALRYEMGRDLGTVLESLGSVAVTPAAGVLPAATVYGMAALMPGADADFRLVPEGTDLFPSVGDRILHNSAERMALLQDRYGDRFRQLALGDVLSKSQAQLKAFLGSADLFAVRTQEIDALGENLSVVYARRLISDVIGDLRTVADRLRNLGFDTFVFAADHGHMLTAEVPAGDVIAAPRGDWVKAKRRSLLGQSTAGAPGVLILKCSQVGIVAPVAELAVAQDFKVFTAGAAYFHEGVSLQECVLPVVVLQAREPVASASGGEEIKLRYRADRFTSRVISIKAWFNSLLLDSLIVRVHAFDGSGPRAKRVGEAADCDARDPATGDVTLRKGEETQIPIRIADDFSGPAIEIRAVDPATGAVLDRLKLNNSVLE